MNASVGIVAIGRNEGARLEACLESVDGQVGAVVYVDSGSTDGSVEMARARGVEVVALDMSEPFTAARARNAGAERLQEIAPELRYVQFVDGDCAVVDGWIAKGAAALDGDPELAVACGWRREREPEATVYNLLCDIEWHRPPGVVYACGGDAMMRLEHFVAVGGFDPSLIAGEEPELCVRLRARGWRILRIGEDMTLHDAAMTSWRQWWLRAKRSGYAYGLVNGVSKGAIWGREVRSILAYCVGLPVVAVTASMVFSPWALLLFAAPLLSVYRVRARELAAGRPRRAATAWAWSCILCKVPAMTGLLSYVRDRLRGARRGLIEYKN
jgi:GT2 family glycosyltransferase